MKRTFLLICTWLFTVIVNAQDHTLFMKKWMVQGADTIPYRLLLPLNYDATKKYPLIFFLHGSGERGSDNELQLVHGATLFEKEETRKDFPAIVVFPQCYKDGYWSNVLRTFDEDQHIHYNFIPAGNPTRAMELLQTLLTYIMQTYPVKKDQVYVGGLSMGGMGTYELVRRSPGIFAAAFPICAGAVPSTAAAMKEVSWWVFHGGKDDVVAPVFAEKMVAALKKEKASVKFTFYPEANQNNYH